MSILKIGSLFIELQRFLILKENWKNHHKFKLKKLQKRKRQKIIIKKFNKYINHKKYNKLKTTMYNNNKMKKNNLISKKNKKNKWYNKWTQYLKKFKKKVEKIKKKKKKK